MTVTLAAATDAFQTEGWFPAWAWMLMAVLLLIFLIRWYSAERRGVLERASLIFSSTALEVSGKMIEESRLELLREVRRAFDGGAVSVIVDLQKVVEEDVGSMARFAASIMAERLMGRQVQVVVREPALHEACCSLAGASDWLISDVEADATGARSSFHFNRDRAE